MYLWLSLVTLALENFAVFWMNSTQVNSFKSRATQCRMGRSPRLDQKIE